MILPTRIDIGTAPEMAFFCVEENDFKDDGYWRELIDVLGKNGAYNLLTVSMRIKGHPITEPETLDLFRRIVDHAKSYGLEVALDLDPRLARGEFNRRYPDELQEIIYLTDVPIEKETGYFEVKPEMFGDHMSGGGTPYVPLAGRFIKALAYRISPEGEVVAESLEDVSEQVSIIQENENSVECKLKGISEGLGRVTVLVGFSLFSPDVFSPNIVSYQRELLELYSSLPLGGVVKDEWGFPPSRPSLQEQRAFWYSESYDDAYRKFSGRESLLDDLFLMYMPHQDKEAERLCAINCYMELNRSRNVEIETRYYEDVKDVYGEDVLITKHATWYPRIGIQEIFKNGISWWGAKRDWAQTDEITPLSVCTSLSKKFNSPLWLNEGYSHRVEHYQRNIWRYAVAGGRMVYHPLYPWKPEGCSDQHKTQILAHGLLLNENVIRAECRVRLLNFITKSQLDCPVAFIFGHAGLMNWAGSGFLDYGEELSLDLWRNGYAVDLYPSTEITEGTFKVSNDGYLMVGPQKYKKVVLYRPDLCPKEVAEFFQRNPSANTGKYLIGTWNRDFHGKPFDGAEKLTGFQQLLSKDALETLLADLNSDKTIKQPPIAEPFELFKSNQIGLPAPDGLSHLIDGTCVRIAAMERSAGDVIDETIRVKDIEFKVRAEGLFAVRVNDDGELEAFAAGALTRFEAPGFELRLDDPLDIALWRDGQQWRGIVQDTEEIIIPEQLKKVTENWTLLTIPEPFVPEDFLEGTD